MNKNLKFFLIINAILLIMISILLLNGLLASKLDFAPQHLTFFDYFRNLFFETKEFFPQFMMNLGAGQNIYNIAYYGLYSPYLLVSYLVPFINSLIFLNIAMYINIIISTYFLFKLLNKDYDTKISAFVSITFMLCTPLLFHFKRHIMFIDYMMFLIMSLYFVRSYFENNKTYMIIIFNTLIVFTSFYYSISCFFVIFIYYVFLLIKYNKFNIKEFIIFNLKIYVIPVLISSILTIPTLFSILNSRTTGENSINFIDLFINKEFGILYGSYSLGIIFIMFFALVYNSLNKKKEIKFLSIIILIVLLVPLFNFILNGGLYIREKILIPFLPLIMIMFSDFLKEKIKKKDLITYLVLAFIIFIVGYRNYHLNDYLLHSFITFFIIDVVIGLIFFLCVKNNKYNLGYLIIIIFMIVVNFASNSIDNRISSNEYNNIYQDKIYTEFDTIINDTNYFKTSILDKNSSAIVNYTYDIKHNSTSLYSSTYNKEYYNFLHSTFNAEFRARNELYHDISQNSIFNLYMGVKYVFNTDMNDMFYELIETVDDTKLYKSNYALPLVYSSSNIMPLSEFNKLDYVNQIQALFKYIVIDEDINYTNNSLQYKEINPNFQIIKNKNNVQIYNDVENIVVKTDKASKLTIKFDENINNKVLFISFDLEPQSCNIGDLYVKINKQLNKLTCKEWLYYNNNNKFSYMISDTDIENLDIEIAKGTYNISNFKMYTVDAAAFINEFNEAKNIHANNNIISADIELEENGYVNINIPYDKGFIIKVNSEKIDYFKTNTAFIGFPLNKGTYEIQIQYINPYFNISFKIMMFGILIFGYIIWIELIRKER